MPGARFRHAKAGINVRDRKIVEYDVFSFGILFASSEWLLRRSGGGMKIRTSAAGGLRVSRLAGLAANFTRAHDPMSLRWGLGGEPLEQRLTAWRRIRQAAERFGGDAHIYTDSSEATKAHSKPYDESHRHTRQTDDLTNP